MRVLPITLPAPSKAFHALILIFARPHNVSLIHCANVECSHNKPQNYQYDSQRASNAVDGCTFQCTAGLDSCEGKTCVRKDESPPIERERHLANTRNNGYSGDEEKPVGEEGNEKSSHDADDADDLAVRNHSVGKEVLRNEVRCS